MRVLPAPPLPDRALIAKLRKDLRAANWTVQTVAEMLGPAASAALAREQRVPALVALDGNESAAAQLTKAFLLGERADFSGVFPALTLAGAQELGLVDAETNPLVDLRPHAAELTAGDFNWWIASDRCEMQTGLPLLPEHVLGIGPATLSLLRMTIRDEVASALDLGTGCGIQALYLATHARRVVATDISERACRFAEFNALLNQADIEVRRGSLFEPVAGETFDLITSNPPFVITPPAVRERGVHEYRDGGLDRDDLIKVVVERGPSHLNPGGILEMLLNWEQPRKRTWQSRVGEWLKVAQEDLDSGGLAAWLVQRDRLDAARYAELWLRDSGGNLRGRAEWEHDYRQWISSFRDVGVEEIGMGFLVAKRSPAPGLTFVAEEISEGEFPQGTTAKAALENLALPDRWEEMALVRATDVRERRHYRPGSPDPQVVELTQGAGMGRVIRVGSVVAALIGSADGELLISQVVTALSVLTDSSEAEIWLEIESGLPELLRAGMASLNAR